MPCKSLSSPLASPAVFLTTLGSHGEDSCSICWVDSSALEVGPAVSSDAEDQVVHCLSARSICMSPVQYVHVHKSDESVPSHVLVTKAETWNRLTLLPWASPPLSTCLVPHHPARIAVYMHFHSGSVRTPLPGSDRNASLSTSLPDPAPLTISAGPSAFYSFSENASPTPCNANYFT